MNCLSVCSFIRGLDSISVKAVERVQTLGGWMDGWIFINCDWVYTRWQCESTIYMTRRRTQNNK